MTLIALTDAAGNHTLLIVERDSTTTLLPISRAEFIALLRGELRVTAG